MANIELVTSHQGTAHITTDQVKDLIAGLSGDISGIKVFANLDDAFEYTIISGDTINIKTGQALAGGFHWQLTDAYDWIIDPGSVGYSRIDSLYLVIYEDSVTTYQSADFVYQIGTLYQNGTSGIVPDAPTGTNIKQAFEFLRCLSSDSSIVSVTSLATTYLSNDALESSVSGTVTQVQTNTTALNGLRFGVDGDGNYGYYKVGADTVTPFRNATGTAIASEVLAGKTFSNASSDNIAGTMINRGAWTGSTSGNGNIAIPVGYHNGNGYVSGASSYNSGYNAGNTAGYNSGYSAGTTAGYNSGYSAGITQGRKDKSSHTIRVATQMTGYEYSWQIYCDEELIDSGRKASDTGSDTNVSVTAKTSYQYGLTLS